MTLVVDDGWKTAWDGAAEVIGMTELWELTESTIRGGSETVEPVKLVTGSETSPEAGCCLFAL
jgi:hypothetical protein